MNQASSSDSTQFIDATGTTRKRMNIEPMQAYRVAAKNMLTGAERERERDAHIINHHIEEA